VLSLRHDGNYCEDSVARTVKQIRLVTFSTLYPNAIQPNHGVFVENRLRHLIASGEVVSRVVAPVPYFPSRSPRFGQYAQFAQVPAWEERHGLTVHHPRYPLIPKIGMNLSPWLMALAVLPAVKAAIKAQGGADILDAHYLFPDGVAATMIGKMLDIPVVMTARGTDVSLIPNYPVPRRLIQKACRNAAGIITVSAALKDGLIGMNVDPDHVTVLRNGVDLKLFRPLDRQATRQRLGLTGPTLISVGHLIERKGHDLIVQAMPSLPEFTLLIAGEGPERANLEKMIADLGVGNRVRLLGARPHAELPELYGAADALILASSREGWANVLLEAMACGTPAIGAQIWGNPEVIAKPEAGILMAERSAKGVADAVHALFGPRMPTREATRAYASAFSWDATTEGQIELFRRIMAHRPRP
jgi:glycosyltransferase involved in cell wall biosynthesis